jgi:hypothetical protein
MFRQRRTVESKEARRFWVLVSEYHAKEIVSPASQACFTHQISF